MWPCNSANSLRTISYYANGDHNNIDPEQYLVDVSLSPI
jgi:hypothetical protein